MSVKFIRTCDRCGKVIEERNDTLSIANHLPSTKSTSLEFHKANADGMYDLCEDCWEDFCQFMRGQLVCDISDRDVLSEEIDNEQHKEKHDVKLKPDTRVHHRWTEEDAFLIEERRRKVKTPEMAKKLGLSVSQVRSRIKYLDWLSREKENAKSESDEVVYGLDGTVYTKDKDGLGGWTGWSPEALDLARQHNENCEEPKTAKVSTIVDKSKISASDAASALLTLADKSKIQLKPGTHTYHQWTKEEDQFIAFHSAGMTMNELANKFGVTLTAVQQRKSMILNGKVQVNRED